MLPICVCLLFQQVDLGNVCTYVSICIKIIHIDIFNSNSELHHFYLALEMHSNLFSSKMAISCTKAAFIFHLLYLTIHVQQSLNSSPTPTLAIYYQKQFICKFIFLHIEGVQNRPLCHEKFELKSEVAFFLNFLTCLKAELAKRTQRNSSIINPFPLNNRGRLTHWSLELNSHTQTDCHTLSYNPSILLRAPLSSLKAVFP